MRGVKRILYRVWRLTGLAGISRSILRRRLKILLYHGVAPSGEGMFNYRRKFVDTQSFERQIAYLAQRYKILPLDEAVARLKTGTLPAHALAITFDDGYRNNYDYAFPVLKQLRIPATVFLATDFVFRDIPLWVDRLEYAFDKGQGEEKNLSEKKAADARMRTTLKSVPDDERIRALRDIERARDATLVSASKDARYAPLTIEMIREMSAGGITFGAHTKSHPILSQLPLDRARQEIFESQKIVEEKCRSASMVFCYPNGQKGDWTEEHEDVLREIGQEGALSTIEGANTKNTHAFRLRRYTMDDTDDWDAFIAAESGFRGILQNLRKKVWS